MALDNNKLGFINAYFALFGMGLVRSPGHNFTIEVREALKAGFMKYSQKTKLVDELFRDVAKIR